MHPIALANVVVGSTNPVKIAAVKNVQSAW
jgi:hypothetical protein